MRRLIATSVLVCAAVLAVGMAFAKDVSVRVYVDDRQIRLNPPAMLRDGRAYVGIRGIARALGASTKWDADSKTATVTLGNKRTRIKQSEGITVKNVLFLPLRLTGEAVGCTVEWDSGARAVRICKEPPPPRCYG